MSGIHNLIGDGISAISSAVSSVLSGWDSTDDVAAPTTGVSVNGFAQSAQKAAVAAGDAVKLVTNLFGEIVVAGFTWATQSIRTEEINPMWFGDLPEELENTTNIPIDTHHYPGPNGYSLTGVKNISLIGEMSIGGGSNITLKVQVSNDPSLASGSWEYLGDGFRADTNTTGISQIAVSGTTESFILNHDSSNYAFLRYEVVNDNATNSIKLFARRNPL
jgi:hypothetical protein